MNRPKSLQGDPPALKPRAVLRIGVTGHRPNRLSADPTVSLRATVRKTFEDIAGAFADTVSAASVSEFFSAERPLLRIATGMAEGADLVAAEAARSLRDAGEALDWSIEAVLPAPRADYIAASRWSVAPGRDKRRRDVAQDMLAGIGSADLVVELPRVLRPISAEDAGIWRACTGSSADTDVSIGDPVLEPLLPDGLALSAPFPPNHTLDYEQAGAFLLRQCDLLVAVWDRKPPAGPGGTASLVALARSYGIPVIVLDPAGLAPAVLESQPCDDSLAAFGLRAQLAPLIEAMLLPADGTVGHEDRPHGPVRGLLSRLVAHGAEPSGREKLAEFLHSSRPADAGPLHYERLADLLSFGWRARTRTWPMMEHDWRWTDWDTTHREGMAGRPEAADLQSTFAKILTPRYLHADDLATHFANQYRSAYVRAYSLSALAVLVAVLGFVLPEVVDPYLQKAILALVELVILYVIARVIVRRGEHERWHQKWLDYRAMAELLRHQRFLSLIAEFGHLEPGRSRRRPWWLWYVQATIREIGIPRGVLGSHYQTAALAAARMAEIASQIRYHTANARRMHALDDGLHIAGTLSFWAAAVALISYLIVYATWLLLPGSLHAATSLPAGGHGASWLTALKLTVGFFAAVMPAIGAAIAGIRYTGEFKGSSERSLTMAAELERVAKAIDKATETAVEFNRTRDLLYEAAQVLSEDLDAFQELYTRKPLALPG